MAVVLDATVGGSTSNTYLDLTDAESIAVGLVGGADWIALTADEKNMSLAVATTWLETLVFGGTRCSPSTDDAAKPQRLKWPRSGISCDGVAATCSFIPYAILQAEVILAIQYTTSPGSFPGAGGGSNAPSGTFTKRQKPGDLEIEYAQFNNNTGSSCDDCDNPAIIQAFPFLDDLLGCWINIVSSDSGRVLTRECCDQWSLSPSGVVTRNYMDPPPY